MVAPGVNTYDLDQEGKRLMAEMGATSACYNYGEGRNPFPAYTCLSVNDEIVHGIGRLDRVLQDGDLVTVDVSLYVDGWIGDNARTIPVGSITDEQRTLLDSTREALHQGLDEARTGNRVGYISNTIERYLRKKQLGIVRDFVGHGVGLSMHEAPQIPNFGPRRRGEFLRPGMTLAIEPMVTLGNPKTRMGSDGWTALTRDGSDSAHFEHTVLVTKGAPEILTIPEGQTQAEFLAKPSGVY